MIYLFYRFFFIGIFAVGGGLAIIPFLEDLINNTPQISQDELLNIIALAEITPGAIGVNMATYTGFVLQGILGGMIATLGLICPSLFMVWFVGKFWLKAKNNPTVISVFNAVKASVVGLLFSVFINIFIHIFQKDNAFSFETQKFFLFMLLLVLSLKFKISPILYIVAMAFIGILLKL